MSALWSYISGKIIDNIYWANTQVTSSQDYKTQPEVASIKINGKNKAADTNTASTKNVSMQYDATLEVLNFVFS